jgi:hypothetical protein
VKAKQVATRLASMPFECTDGAIVTFQKSQFSVAFDDTVLGRITEQQFIKAYWPKGKILPTT